MELKGIDFDDPFFAPGEEQAQANDNQSIFEKVLIRCMERSYERNERGKFSHVAVVWLDRRFTLEDLPRVQRITDKLANEIYGPPDERNFVFKVRLNRSKLNLWLAKKREVSPRKKRNDSPLVLGMPPEVLAAIREMNDFDTVVIHQDKVLHALSSIKTNLHKHIDFHVKVWLSPDSTYMGIYRQPKELTSAVYGRDFSVIRADV